MTKIWKKKLAASRSNFIRETLLPLYFRYILIFNLQTTVQIKKSIKKHIRRNEIKLLNSVVESLLLSLVLIKVVIHLYTESIKKRTSLISEFTPLEIATESCVANEDCFANLSIYRIFFCLHLLLNCNSGTVLDGWVGVFKEISPHKQNCHGQRHQNDRSMQYATHFQCVEQNL